MLHDLTHRNSSRTEAGNLQTKWALLLALCLAVMPLFGGSLASIVRLSLRDDRYSHLLAVPAVTLALIAFGRRRILADARYWWRGGFVLAVLSVSVHLLSRVLQVRYDPAWGLCLDALALVIAWIAAFAGCLGKSALKESLFPLCFLFLFAPLPPQVLSFAEIGMQKASAELSYAVMRSSGMPVFRDGLKFLLPGIEIEVARECSGIRSSIGLLMTALVLGYLFLPAAWKRLCFIALTVPIVIFKNALRITILSWLGVHVSRDLLTGPLHHQGGPLFALIALAIQLPLLFALQRIGRQPVYGEEDLASK